MVKLKEGKSEVRELHFQRGPQPRGQGPSDADASEYAMPFAFHFLNLSALLVLPATSTCRHYYFAQVLSFSRIHPFL